MSKKEVDFTVIEVDKERQHEEAGRFKESNRYRSDQKTEARLNDDSHTNAVEDEDASKRSAGKSENTSVALGSKNQELKNENENENENENTMNHSNASGSGLQKDAKEQTTSRNEYPKNKGISKKQESKKIQMEGTSLFIRPKNTPSFRQSLKYSVEVVMWIFYHSIVLAVIPTIILVIIYGPLRLFVIMKGNLKIYYVSSVSFCILCLYAETFGLSAYLFGKQKVLGLVYKLAVPFCLISISLIAVRIFFEVTFLGIAYYISYFTFFYLWMKNISMKRQPQTNAEDGHNRYDVLAYDGTPMAIVKGLTPFLLLYFLSTFYIVPFCMKSGIITRIIGRIFVLPFFFNVSDAYMNNQIINKSFEYLKYRMVPGNLTSVMFLAILRFMILYSSSPYDTFVMSLSSGVFEVILWASYIPRSIYTMRMIEYIKLKASLSVCGNKRINNLNESFPESPNPNELNGVQHNHEDIARIEKLDLTIEGFKRLFSQLNQEDTKNRYVIYHRKNRSIILCMSEIQFIIFLPIVLHLCNPIKDYLRIQPIATITHLFASIFIQLPIELLTQIISICLESYIYGIQVPVEKSFMYNLKPVIILQYSLVSLTVIFLSTNTFWIPVEEWPEN